MKVFTPIPPGRTFEDLFTQFQIEREFARRLKSASREERKRIYATMYAELFSRVPRHSRLDRARSLSRTQEANRSKLLLLKPFLTPATRLLEFAPGDCQFSMFVASMVKSVMGVDISDQRQSASPPPPNFSLVVYDGYNLDTVPDESVDVVFSDQLIEHFHPDDTRDHFRIVYRILAKHGVYVFRTPHAFTGPHDVSKHFSEAAEGFHLKEWTFSELATLVQSVGYSRIRGVGIAHGMSPELPVCYLQLVERCLGVLPRRAVRQLSRFVLPRLSMAAYK